MKTLNDYPQLQYFMQAFEYLSAGCLTWKNRPVENSLLAPTLHLICHGIELTLKANLLLQGQSMADTKKFSHGLDGLWYADLNAELRKDSIAIEHQLAGDNLSLVEATLLKYAELNGTKHGNFPLRYQSASEILAPKPNALVLVFLIIARRGILKSVEKIKEERNVPPEEISKFENLLRDSQYLTWHPSL